MIGYQTHRMFLNYKKGIMLLEYITDKNIPSQESVIASLYSASLHLS